MRSTAKKGDVTRFRMWDRLPLSFNCCVATENAGEKKKKSKVRNNTRRRTFESCYDSNLATRKNGTDQDVTKTRFTSQTSII